MSDIRVLQIVTSLNKSSGIARVVLNWHKNIDRTKVQFDYLYFLNTPVNFEREIKELGGNIYKLPYPSIFKPMEFIKAVVSFFKNHRYVTIHSHTTHLNFFYFPIAKFYKIKNIIIHAHGIKYSDNFFSALRNRFMLACVRIFITHKLACSDKSGKAWYGTNGSFIIVNNGIEIDKFKYNILKRDDIRTKLNINNNFVVGHVGRFSYEKNHNFIINIFAEVYKQNNGAILMLVGDGPLKKQIEKKIASLNLANNVKIMGIYNEVSDLYQAMDCFILPSLQEGFPLVAVEAQTAGLPCIFSDLMTDEVKICDSIQISLKHSLSEWADKILEYNKFHRKDNVEIVKMKGFDIKTTTLKIQEFYLKL